MIKLKLDEIISKNQYDLQNIIRFWWDYTPATVVMAYAELVRRNVPVSDYDYSKIRAFCKKYDQPNINSFLDELLTSHQCSSYKELLEKEGIKIETSIARSDQMLYNKSIEEKEAINLLNIFAIIFLILGIIGSIVIWATMGTKEVPRYTRSETEPDALGIFLGFLTLAASILNYAFLRVICVIARNCIRIRERMESEQEN